MGKLEDTIKRLETENGKLFEELKRKKVKLSSMMKELREKNAELSERSRDLSDSVNYAKRIQLAIMPPRYVVNKMMEESFIMYLPKDVVSGDFYFVEKIDDVVINSMINKSRFKTPFDSQTKPGIN